MLMYCSAKPWNGDLKSSVCRLFFEGEQISMQKGALLQKLCLIGQRGSGCTVYLRVQTQHTILGLPANWLSTSL